MFEPNARHSFSIIYSVGHLESRRKATLVGIYATSMISWQHSLSKDFASFTHFPHCFPTFRSRHKALMLRQPSDAAFRISLSVTPAQMQTYMQNSNANDNTYYWLLLTGLQCLLLIIFDCYN